MPIINYWVDPMGIFRQDFSRQVIEPNQHYAKMKYLTEEVRDYNSFIFGSSKAGNIDSRRLEGGDFYNMTYSMGVPYEWQKDLEILVDRGYEIKKVVLCLDEESYTRTHDQNVSFLRWPYSANRWDRWAFETKYLFRMPDFKVTKEAIYSLNKDKPFRVSYDIHGSGIPFKETREAYIEANMDTHLQDERFDMSWAPHLPKMEESLEALRAIRNMCDEKGIDLKVLFAPIHHKKLATARQNRLEEYKNKVAGIVDFIDFSGEHPIANDNQYWFEQVHFRSKVGDMMVDRINGDRGEKPFGVRVSNRLTQLGQDGL